MSIGVMMAGGKGHTGRRVRPREVDDFYPTPPEATEALLDVEHPFLCGGWYCRPIWEPACGDGAICRVLEKHGHEVIATDLVDRGYGSGGVDFLTTHLRRSQTIITNPPFSLAPAFIDHALGTLGVDYLALLLKSTFFHADSRMELYQHFTPSIIYPLTWRLDFMGLGAPTMECAWFVWRRQFDPWGRTQYQPIRRPGAKALGEKLL